MLILGFRLRAMLGLFDCVYVCVFVLGCWWCLFWAVVWIVLSLLIVWGLLVVCWGCLCMVGAYWFGLLDLFTLVWV